MKLKLKLNSKLIFFIMCGVAALLAVGALALTFLGSNWLAKKTNSLTELKLENAVLDEQKRSVTQAQKDIETYAELEQIAKKVVPQDKDQARTVRGIIQLAGESGISIASISFPSSTLGLTGAGSGVAKTGGPSSLTQVKPVEGIAGVYQLEITIQSTPDTTNFTKLLDFLKRLEANRSTSQVSSLTITPNSSNRALLTFSMVINAYIKP
jgi:hypothetical protein